MLKTWCVCSIALLAVTPPLIPDGAAEQDLSKTASQMADKLNEVREDLKDLPCVEGKWENVGQASNELLTTVRKLKETRLRVLATAKTIGNSVGDFRAELEKLRQHFVELEASARSHIDGSDGTEPLVGEILETVKKEADLYAASAENCEQMSVYFAAKQADFKINLRTIDKSGAVLDRLERVALLYQRMAELGQGAERLSNDLNKYSEQLKLVISQFEKLDADTREVISDLKGEAENEAQP